MSIIKDYKQKGFLFCPAFFGKDKIDKILLDAKRIFVAQMKRTGVTDLPALSDESAFSQAMFLFFQKDTESFINCGKQVQHLISLHRLSLSQKIIDFLTSLEISFPNISTRPVLYFNHPKLAKKKVYHTVFPHQDWRSMQGSLDSIVLWVPLVDIPEPLGALQIIPASHKWGLITEEMTEGFGKVQLDKQQIDNFQSIEVKAGDALFFSSFLIHQSGNNITDRIRWSCHFRYNNLDESTFIERKFSHPYIYKPQKELITKRFPTKKHIEDMFSNVS